MYGKPNFPTSENIFLSNDPPETSLIISTPISKDFFAIVDLNVSIEIIILGKIFRIDFITSLTLFHSSSSFIISAPGLVEHPPTSMIPAPSSIIFSTFNNAFFLLLNKSPS